MSEQKKENLEIFLKQRTSLLIVSIGFWLISNAANIETLKFPSLDLKITNPARIYALLGFVFIYFLVRYYQYFKLTIPARLIDNAVEALVYDELRKRAFVRYKKRFAFDHPQKTADENYSVNHSPRRDKDNRLHVFMQITIREEQKSASISHDDHEEIISKWEERVVRSWALAYVTFRWHYWTEYYLPIGVAVISAFWTCWVRLKGIL